MKTESTKKLFFIDIFNSTRACSSLLTLKRVIFLLFFSLQHVLFYQVIHTMAHLDENAHRQDSVYSNLNTVSSLRDFITEEIQRFVTCFANCILFLEFVHF